MLHPGQPVPALNVETLSHGKFSLPGQTGENGALVIFYRGLHCPICIRQMQELEGKLDVFSGLGVDVIMISGDSRDRAEETAQKAGISALKLGYGFDLKAARDDWGLHMSSAREGSAEPAFFFEPGHFYIGADHRLYFGWVQTAPFARPQIDDIAGAIRFRLEKGYPPRGMYTGKLPGEA